MVHLFARAIAVNYQLYEFKINVAASVSVI